MHRLVKNNRGSVTPVGMLLLYLGSFLLISLWYQFHRHHQEIKLRSTTYLCHKHQVTKAFTYWKAMHRLNMAILAAFLAGPKAQPLHRTLILTQSAYHFAHVKKFLSIAQCDWPSRALMIKKSPYGARPSRGPDGRAIQINQHWEIRSWKSPKLLINQKIGRTRSFPAKEVSSNWRQFFGWH